MRCIAGGQTGVLSENDSRHHRVADFPDSPFLLSRSSEVRGEPGRHFVERHKMMIDLVEQVFERLGRSVR